MISIGASTGSTQTVTSRIENALDVMTLGDLDETVVRIGSLGTLYPPPELRRRHAELVLRASGADVLTVSGERGTVVETELVAPSIVATRTQVTEELTCPARVALGADGTFGFDATATGVVRRLLVAPDPVAGAFAPDEDAYVAVFRGPIKMEGALELESQVLATNLRVGTVLGTDDLAPVSVLARLEIAADVDMAVNVAAGETRTLRVAALEALQDVAVHGTLAVDGDLSTSSRVVATAVDASGVTVANGAVSVSAAYPADAAAAPLPLRVSVSNADEASLSGDAGVVCVTPQRRLGVGTAAPRADLHVVDGASIDQDAVVVLERFSSNPAPTLLVRGTSLLSGDTELLRLDASCNLTLHAGATSLSAPGATATLRAVTLAADGEGLRTPVLLPATDGETVLIGGDMDLGGAQLVGVTDLSAAGLAVSGATALADGAVTIDAAGDATFPSLRVRRDVGAGGELAVTGTLSGRATLVAEATEAGVLLRRPGGDAGVAATRRGGDETVLFHTFPEGQERDAVWVSRTIAGLTTVNETCLHRSPTGTFCGIRVTEQVGRDVNGAVQTSGMDLTLLPDAGTVPGRTTVGSDLVVAGEIAAAPPSSRTPPTAARCLEILDAVPDVLADAAGVPELTDADGNLRVTEALAVLWGAVRAMRAG